MRFKQTLPAAIVVAIIVLVAGCGDRGKSLLIRVGDWTLDKSTYRKMATIKFRGIENAAGQPIEAHEEFLNDQLIRRLKIVDGRRRGVENYVSVQNEFKRVRDRAAVAKLHNVKITEKVIPEKEIRDFYEKDTVEIHASHILMVPREELSDEDIRMHFLALRQRLLGQGADFTELAKVYNEDRSTPDGDIGWFRWGAMVDKFQEVAFSLKPGEISQPVKTEYGWHLIKLHDRRELTNRPSYEDARNGILQTLIRKHSGEIFAATNSFYDNLREERNLISYTENIEKIVNALTDQPPLKKPRIILPEELLQLPLTEIDGGKIKLTANDVVEQIRTSARSGKMSKSTETLQERVEMEILSLYVLPDVAREEGFFEDPEVLRAASEARDQALHQQVRHLLLYNLEPPPEEELRRSYEENIQKYVPRPRHTLTEILVSDKNLADELAGRINAGEDIAELAADYTERPGFKERKGRIGPIRDIEYGKLGQYASKAEIGQLIGPFKNGNYWSLFKVTERTKPSPTPYDEVRRRILSDYDKNRREVLEKAWEDSLSQHVEYEVYPLRLEGIFADVEIKESRGIDD